MTQEQIEAIGHFLAYYRSDLFYIEQFQNYKRRTISLENYTLKKRGSFYSFLIEFRIVRNFAEGQVNKLLEETINFIEINDIDCTDVDSFALKLSRTNLTRNNIMTSMASKILFLNNPYAIIPMDSRTRKSLRQNKNTYTMYSENIHKFKFKNLSLISEMLEYVTPLTDIIHQDFPLLKDLNLIVENRLIDKLLWTTGR